MFAIALTSVFLVNPCDVVAPIFMAAGATEVHQYAVVFDGKQCWVQTVPESLGGPYRELATPFTDSIAT